MGYLTENNGEKSASRLIFVIGSFWNMLLCTYLILTGIEPTILIIVYSSIEAVLVGIKLGQKPMEQKK